MLHSLPFRHIRPALGIAASLLMPTVAHAADMSEYDTKAAVVFAYFSIGNDDNPNASITAEQFSEQIEEIGNGHYTVKPLPEIVDALLAGQPLPPRTVALTFDGADQSVVDIALPVLEKNNLPFTVFVPSDKIGKLPYMGWNDLKTLKKSGLANFGIHPSGYTRLTGTSETEIRRQLNNSIAAVRDRLDVTPALLSYPYGDYDEAYKKIVKAAGIKAAFGQQSGVAYAGADMFSLPRFTLTERFGDMDRFLMTANALPLPVSDVSPANPSLKTLSPAIGFTVPEVLAKSLGAMSCFSSVEEKPDLVIMDNRVELRLNQPFTDDKPRINCTLPATAGADGEMRWRWFGMLYTIPPELLQKAQPVGEGDVYSETE